MNQLDSNDKLIQRFIYNKPHIVARLLKANNYRLSDRVTLPEITEKTFTAIYKDRNKKFVDDLVNAINDADKSNFIGIAIASALSIGSAILGSNQAKKQRELQKNIALANLENEKLLSEEELRVLGEVERTKILANTLLSYRQTLQGESTDRQKNVYIYLLALGTAMSIMYGTYILLKEN